MHKVIFLSMLSAFSTCAIFAQENASFRIRTSGDTVLMGNYFVVCFTIENASGQEFQPPLFEQFDVIGGPNLSSSFSVVNGQVSQQASYTFYLRPRDAGNFYIEPASVRVDDKILETEPVEIIVLPNPEGITQDPEPLDNFHFRFEELPPHSKEEQQPKGKTPGKKRKTYKI